MSIQLVERQRYTDDEGNEVIEYETTTEQNNRRLLETFQKMQIESIQRQVTGLQTGFTEICKALSKHQNFLP